MMNCKLFLNPILNINYMPQFMYLVLPFRNSLKEKQQLVSQFFTKLFQILVK